MKHRHSLLLLGLALVFCLPLHAQQWASGRRLSFLAYAYNQGYQWQKAVNKLQALNQQNWENKYEWAIAAYGRIGYCIASESCQDVDDQIDEAQEIAEALLKVKPKSSKAQALYGALLAMEVGRSPAKAIYLGPRSSSYLDDALESDPRNPTAWVEKGNMRFHAPALFGGDMTEAVNCFKKAVTLFDQQPALRKDNWLYLHALAWLGKSYEEEGKNQEALKAYQKALQFEPNFHWVKNELMPALQKKI
ncbi:MAG: tetratricopeptide repeat protein [Bacteroidota bacterium]